MRFLPGSTSCTSITQGTYQYHLDYNTDTAKERPNSISGSGRIHMYRTSYPDYCNHIPEIPNISNTLSRSEILTGITKHYHSMKHFLVALLCAVCSVCAYSQTAIKTNLIYDVATTPNIGIETATGQHYTAALTYAINPWSFDSGEKKAKHWVLMPEIRRWLCSRFNGHFIGIHAMGGQFNAANVSLPVPGIFFGGDNLTREVKDHRYQGGFIGAGITYGYQWILSRNWNIEAQAGIGYGHAWYDKYACTGCGRKIADGNTNYFGVTKLGISILYLF